MTFLDALARLIPFRQPTSLHDPRPAPFDPPADLKVSRLDLLDGRPRPARPVDECDDLARHLVAERRGGRHAGDTYQEWLDQLVADAEDQWPATRPIGRHRAEPTTTTLGRIVADALDLPCRQPMTVPPFEACDQPADPDHPEQLCDEHAGRRRT